MQRMGHAAAGMALALIASSPAIAQLQKIEWKQTVNQPKGQNMPQGVTADILGIEAGDGYAGAKAKLEKLKNEGFRQPQRQMSVENYLSRMMFALLFQKGQCLVLGK